MNGASNQINEGTIYVKLNEYKKALTLFTALKDKVVLARETLQKIEELREEERIEIELWQRSLSEIENKMVTVDSIIMNNR